MQIIDYYGTSDTASLMIIKQVQYGASKKKRYLFRNFFDIKQIVKYLCIGTQHYFNANLTNKGSHNNICICI